MPLQSPVASRAEVKELLDGLEIVLDPFAKERWNSLEQQNALGQSGKQSSRRTRKKSFDQSLPARGLAHPVQRAVRPQRKPVLQDCQSPLWTVPAIGKRIV